MDGAAAGPAPDPADDLGFVVAFNDEHGALGSAAPTHLAEPVGVRVRQEWRAAVHDADHRIAAPAGMVVDAETVGVLNADKPGGQHPARYTPDGSRTV